MASRCLLGYLYISLDNILISGNLRTWLTILLSWSSWCFSTILLSSDPWSPLSTIMDRQSPLLGSIESIMWPWSTIQKHLPQWPGGWAYCIREIHLLVLLYAFRSVIASCIWESPNSWFFHPISLRSSRENFWIKFLTLAQGKTFNTKKKNLNKPLT